MLTMGGIDAIYAGNTTLTAAIEEFGYHQEDICAGISLDSAELYLATSPGLDSSEEHAWLKAYEVLQKDGTVARLQSKYAIAK